MLAVLFLFHSASARAADSAPPHDARLDSPAFSLSPRDLLSLRAKHAPAGLDVEVLLDETFLRYSDKGLLTTEYHAIYRVLTDAGAESWGGIQASYGPWYQNKASLRARVITKEGVPFELDTSTLVDALASQSGGNVYSDLRRVSGPLPAVRAGAVVETQIVIAEHKPFFAAGTVERNALYNSTYTGVCRVSVEAPQKLPLNIRGRGPGVPKPVTSTRGTTKVVSFVAHDILPLSRWPEATDPAEPNLPTVEVTTAKSWASIAASYGSIVDAEVNKLDAKALVAQIVSPSDSADTKLAKILAYTHEQVRYTGLELGERSILPNPLADTLQRHYGDCKDKSTLLVALLRAAGFVAHVALLNVGPGLDVATDMPGLGLFDHAIVHLGGKSERFIDPTDPYSTIDDLPYGDQDRLALVTSAKTTALTRTPRTTAALSQYDEVVEISFPELGKATIRETVSGKGPLQAGLRGNYDKDEDALREDLKTYAQNRYKATLERARAEGAADLKKAFSLVIEAKDSESLQTYDNGGLVPATPNELYANLPKTLYDTPEAERSDEERDLERKAKDPREREPEKTAVYVMRPHTARITYVLRIPEGFAWNTLPDPLSISVEGIKATRSAQAVSEQEVKVSFALEAQTRIIAKDKLELVRQALYDFGQESSADIRFVHKASDALTAMRAKDAIAIHAALLAKNPKSVPVRSRYAQELLGMGLGSEARKVAEKLAKDEPSSARAQWTLGYVYLFDEIGRDSYAGADFTLAEKAFRKALASDPEEELYYNALGIVLQRNALRAHPVDQARLTELGELYEQQRTKFDDHSHDLDRLRNYVWRGKFREANKFAEQVSASTDRNKLWVSAVASLDGAEGAQRKAEQLAGGDPRDLLGGASAISALMGRYDVAQRLASLPLVKKELDGLNKLYVAASKRDQCIAALSPAAKFTYDWFSKLALSAVTIEDLDTHFQNLPEQSVDAYALSGFAYSLFDEVNVFGRDARALGGRFVTDALPCFQRWDVEERDGAVRVRLFSPGAPTSDDATTLYLRHTKKGYEVVAARKKGRTVPYARAIFLALSQKNLPEARVWLEWAKPIVDPNSSYRDRVDFFDALKALWPKDPKTAREDELSLIAAAMQAGVGNEPRDSGLLEAALKQKGRSPEATRGLRFLIGFALRYRNPARASEMLAPLHAEFPEDKNVWQHYVRALFGARRHDTLSAELDAYEAKHPDDRYPHSFRYSVDRREGRFGKALDRTFERMKDHRADRGELNGVAWEAMFAGADLARAIELSKAACDPREEASYGSLHTLAALYAEARDADNTYDYTKATLAKNQSQAVTASDWLLVGGLAEVLGLTDAAREAYSKAKHEEDDDFVENSSYLLVQKRLKALTQARAGRR